MTRRAAPLWLPSANLRQQRPGVSCRRAARTAGPPPYLAGGVLLLAEPNGTAGPVGFLDCWASFFSLLLRS